MPGIVASYPKACKKEKTVYIGEPFLNFSTLRSPLDGIAKPIIMVSLCVCQCRKPAPLAGMTLFFYGSRLLHRWRMYSQSRFKSFFTGKCCFILDGWRKQMSVRTQVGKETKQQQKKVNKSKKVYCSDDRVLVFWTGAFKTVGDSRLRWFVVFLIMGVIRETNF